MDSRTASIVVPTFREAANMEPLVTRLFAAARSRGWVIELIVVDDDSNDGTDAIVRGLSGPYDVRIIVRRHQRGLSSAVLVGFEHARYDRLAVLDADLQHPPEIIPELLEKLERPDCDFVIATRYARAGTIASDWPLFRRVASRVATMLARPLAPLSDPMSGCFALRKETFQKARRLDPLGFKIALELFVKCGCRAPCEVPIEFGVRHAGESKAGFGEGMRFLRHLMKLYGHRLGNYRGARESLN